MTGPGDQLHAHTQALRALARALVGAQHADDLVQDTAVQALAQRNRAVAGSRAWLATAMRFVAGKWRRGERRRRAREAAVAGRGDAAPPADAGASVRETFRELTAAVEALPEPYQTTILLRYLREQSPAEVAAAMLVPVATVKTRLQRGLALLREHFAAREHARDHDRDHDRGGDWRARLAAGVGLERWVVPAAATVGGTIMTAGAKWTLGAIAAALVAVAWLGLNGAGAAPPPVATASEASARAATATLADGAAALPPPAAGAAERTAGAGAPPPDALARVRGRLVDETGAPLAGLDVALRGEKVEGGLGRDFDREYGEWVLARGGRRWADQRLATDAGGRFVFVADPAPMALALTVARDGVAHRVSLPDLRTPHDVDLGDVMLPMACTLHVRVVDDRGRAVATPSVQVQFAPGWRQPERALRVDGIQRERQPTYEVAARVGEVMVGVDGAAAARVVAGSYRIAVQGRVPVRGETVEVPPGAASLLHELVVAAAARDDTITGTVVDARGAPLPGVVVTAERRCHSQAGTDALGRFVLQREGQPDGEVAIGLSKAGYEWVPTSQLAAWGARDLRFELRDLLALDVLARDEQGEAVRDFAVWVVHAPEDPAAGRNGPDRRASGEHEHGLARVDGLPRGRHFVIVEPHRWDLWRSDPVACEPLVDRIVRVDVRVPRAADRALRVRRADGSAVAGAQVELLDAAATAPQPVPVGAAFVGIDHWKPPGQAAARIVLQKTRCDRDGGASLHGPAGRDVVARIRGQGFAPFVVGPFRLDEREPLLATVPLGATLVATVGPPEFAQALRGLPDDPVWRNSTHRPGFRLIRGTDRDAEWVPPRDLPGVPIAADGTVTIAGVAAGDWQIALEPWDHSRAGDTTIMIAWPATPLAAVTLRDGATTELALDLTSWLPSSVRGVVRCNGEPARDARLRVVIERPHFATGAPRRWSNDAMTDAEGRFQYFGRGGVVSVCLERGDWTALRPRSTLVPSTGSVTLGPGGSVDAEFDVVACPVRLRVLDATGAAVAVEAVELVAELGARRHALGPTDADGRVAGDVEPGAFTVLLGNARTPIGRVVAAAAGTGEVELRVVIAPSER